MLLGQYLQLAEKFRLKTWYAALLPALKHRLNVTLARRTMDVDPSPALQASAVVTNPRAPLCRLIFVRPSSAQNR